MAKKDEYEQIWSGEWFVFDRPFDLACCHCGLVHGVEMRLNDGHIEIRMTENAKETAKRRRRLKMSCD